MRYEDVAGVLPGIVDGTADADAEVLAFVETDLRAQADLARYRRLLRDLSALRTRHLRPAPGLIDEVFEALDAAGDRGGVHSLLTRRRLAGALGTTAVAATAATAAVLIARSRRHAHRLAG